MQEGEVKGYVVWWLQDYSPRKDDCPFFEVTDWHPSVRDVSDMTPLSIYRLADQPMGKEIEALGRWIGLDTDLPEFLDKFSKEFEIPADWLKIRRREEHDQDD